MFNQGATTIGGGSGTSGGLFGASQPASSFGNPTNNTGNTFGGFGQNQSQSQTAQGKPSFSFGANNNAAAFGAQNSQQNGSQFGSMFGSNQQQPQQQLQQTSSPFGNSLGSNQQSSIFSNPTQITQQPSPQQNQSLFQKSSLFSVSSSDADVNRFKESIRQSPQALTPSQSQNFNYTSPVATSSPAPAPLRHSQSSITLGNSPGYRRRNTPNWASDRRYAPPTPSNLRHVSSFNTADRGPPSHRKASISPSQSPTNSFGSSFSGIPKRSIMQKKAIIQEDPPPTRSIYDSGTSGLTKSETISHSLSDRRGSLASLSSSTPIKAPASPRPNSNGGHSYSNSVVIFGFPSSVTPAVVAHFSRFGTIAENVDSSSRISAMMSPMKSHRAPPTPIQTGKNWLKITYDNPASAARAIHDNGTLIAGQYVVGCIPVTPQNYKEFEVASETSMQSGLRSPTQSIGDFSAFEDTTANFNATDNNILPPMEEETSEISVRTSNGKAMPRTTSMPTLAGSKRVQLKDGRGIFNKQKQMRYSPSLFKIAQEPDQNKNTAAPKSASGKSADGTTAGDNKRLQSGRGGWISWTSKKAQELVFGWDDL